MMPRSTQNEWVDQMSESLLNLSMDGDGDGRYISLASAHCRLATVVLVEMNFRLLASLVLLLSEHLRRIWFVIWCPDLYRREQAARVGMLEEQWKVAKCSTLLQVLELSERVSKCDRGILADVLQATGSTSSWPTLPASVSRGSEDASRSPNEVSRPAPTLPTEDAHVEAEGRTN
jgi:hypothetical protein